MVNIKTQQLYSVTQGAKPSADLVEVGQLWINLADKVLGTKDADGNIVAFAQLTEEEKETLLSGTGDYVPKQGVAADVSVSLQAANASGSVIIDDDADNTITSALTAEGLTVTANKTTGHKAVKLVITKAADVTGTITWTGIDDWLNTESTPVFGESSEAQELCVAIFASPTRVVANVVYNTENPAELDITGIDWGSISGTLSDQEDLKAALDAKASIDAIPDISNLATKTELSQAAENASRTFAPKASPVLTGTATLNGQNIATVNQIPDVSSFVTSDDLASYATTEIVEAEFSSYDKTIKAHIESELTSYLTTSEYDTDKVTFAKLNGANFTGAVTVQTPTEANNPATKSYVDSVISSVYKYRGSVANQAALPQADQVVGDVYNVEDTGDNYAWDGTQWDKLAGTVDLSSYLTIESAQNTYQPKGDYATNTALNAKADASDLASYAPLASPAFTGTPTVNGNTIATTNQVPAITNSTTDLEAGVSALATGAIYLVYE